MSRAIQELAFVNATVLILLNIAKKIVMIPLALILKVAVLVVRSALAMSRAIQELAFVNTYVIREEGAFSIG